MIRYRRSLLIDIVPYVAVFVLGVLWDAPWTGQKIVLYIATPLFIAQRLWRDRQPTSPFAPSKVGTIEPHRSE